MYAQLGNLVFEAFGPLTGLNGRREYSYAEHEVIEGRPALQYTGSGLELRTLNLVFSSAFCVPDLAADELKAMADKHEAVPLFFASGEVLGRYVIQAIEETYHETDPSGSITRASYRVDLIEWPELASSIEIKRTKVATAVQGHATAKAKKSQPARPASTNPRAMPVCVSSRSLCPTE